MEHEIVYKQMRYMKLVDMVRIRKLGYPVHYPYESFVECYRLLVYDIGEVLFHWILATEMLHFMILFWTPQISSFQIVMNYQETQKILKTTIIFKNSLKLLSEILNRYLIKVVLRPTACNALSYGIATYL